MSCFKRICCCCIQDNEINVDENTRLLPKADSSNSGLRRIESPFTLYAFGVSPPGLHLKIIPNDFCKLGISKIACGAEHMLMLSESNFVISAGNNEYGQCARDPTQALIKADDEMEIVDETPVNLRMTAFNIDKFKIIDIAAGSYHSCVLVKPENNYSNSLTKVMVFGHHMACGFTDNTSRFAPTEINIENMRENVTGVYAGQMRSGLVTESGKIFVWGEWFTGSKQSKPKELAFSRPQSIKKIAIGKMFLMALTRLGKVFTVGDNTYGELGISRDIKNTFNLVEVPAFQGTHVIDISAGARHALVLTENHQLFSYGDNSEGQCGIEAARSYQPVEVPLKGILNKSRPVEIFCGEAHSAMITNEGELFTWGDNTAGRLGIKGGISVFRPRIVEDVMGKYISCVSCGGLFTTVLVGPSQFNYSKRMSRVEELIPD